jgi:predicted anti-sigma-YlaC factor YlaD
VTGYERYDLKFETRNPQLVTHPTMKCDEIQMLLSVYVDGETTEQEKPIVEDHVNSCPGCRTVMASFAKVHTVYRELEVTEAPAGFRQRVVQRLEAKPRFAFAWRFPRFVYVLSFSLLVLLSGVVITVHVIKERQQQQASLAAEVYAEDILFEQADTSVGEVFSTGEPSIAEEILNTFQQTDTDTSLFFNKDRPSPNQILRPSGKTRSVIS